MSQLTLDDDAAVSENEDEEGVVQSQELPEWACK